MFMALAFEPSAKTPMDASELEYCRSRTGEYLLPRLQAHFPQLMEVNIQFKEFEWGTDKPSMEYQAYWKVDMSMTFKKTSSKQRLPHPSKLFDTAGEFFQDDFYFDFLKSTPKGRACKVLTTASDVQFGVAPQHTEGGAVKTPNFYLAFVCGETPKKRPTNDELERLRKHLFTRMLQMAREGYPKTFDEDAGGLTLKCVKSEINEQAGKPLVKFNLYIEFEATGVFRENAPSAMVFYDQLASFCLAEFLPEVKQMGGSFGSIRGGAINPCAWIENLHDDVPSMFEAEEVPVHVEFWLALVIPGISGAPNDKKALAVFDEMMNDVVTKKVVDTYGQSKLKSIDFQRESCEFQANVPLPRFNILHRFQADISFSNPVPIPSHVIKTIMNCDIATLLGRINELPAPWNKTIEATMGNAMFEQMSEAKVFTGKSNDVRQAPPPTPTRKPKKKGKTPKSRREPSPPAAVQPDPIPIEPESPLSPTTVTKPPPRSPIPKAQSPPESVKSTPTNKKGESLELWAKVFVALSIPDEPEPTPAQYDKLAEASQAYYAEFLENHYGKDSFERVVVSLRATKFNSGIPEPKYHVYVEWDLHAFFRIKAPNRRQFCQALVSDIDMFVFLKDKVRGIKETPFENAVAIYTEQVNTPKGT